MHSRRRRSALTAIAALAVTAPLLTACGQDAHPGAAAVVDGKRIGVAELQSRVGEVRDAQRSAPQGAQMVAGSGRLTGATLDGMIRDRVVARAARDAKVSVSRGEVQKSRAELTRQAGGTRQMEAMLLQQQGIAPHEIDDRIRMQLSIDKIAEAGNIDPRTPRGNAELSRKLARTSEALNITVNPRFGKWDAQKAVLGTATEPWLEDLSGKQADRRAQAGQMQQPG